MYIRRCLALAIVGLLISTSADVANAREIKYPTASPLFTFQVPDGWSVSPKGGGADALYCEAEKASGLNVQFYSVDNTEINSNYEGFAHAALEAGKVNDIKVVKVGDETLGNNQTAKFVRSTFKRKSGTSFVSLMVFVPMGPDNTCAIHCFLPEEQVDANKAIIDGVLNSIRPVSHW